MAPQSDTTLCDATFPAALPHRSQIAHIDYAAFTGEQKKRQERLKMRAEKTLRTLKNTIRKSPAAHDPKFNELTADIDRTS